MTKKKYRLRRHGVHESRKQNVIVDLHHDIAEDVIARRQRGEKDIFRRIWIPRLREAGICIQVLPIFIDSFFLPEMAIRRELAMVHYLLEEIEQNPADMILARTYKDIEVGFRNKRIAAILALEGAEAIDKELTILGVLYRLGVRVVSLTWNRRTVFADGVGESNSKGGLTESGIRLVRKMEEMGILVDVSHLSEAGFWSLLEVTQGPIIASHSNARALCNHPRNLSDEQIRAVAERHGVVGILIHPSVIDPSNPTINRVVDHMQYIAELVGVNHVALGSDFIRDLVGLEWTSTSEWLTEQQEAFSAIPGLAESTHLPRLANTMLHRGFAESDIQKILRGNCLRIFRHVWL